MPASPFAVNVSVRIEAASLSPAEAAAWLNEFRQALDPFAGPGGIASDPVRAQLERLTGHSPRFANRVRRVHEELVAMGYVPTLPTPRKSTTLPSYISYVDPATGANLGNLNSQKFYVMRQELREVLRTLPHVDVSGRYATIGLTSDAAVDVVVTVGKQQKDAR